VSVNQAFATYFEPIVKIGENLLILPEQKYGYYTVTAIEPLPVIIHDFGSVSSESESKDINVSALQLNEGEVGQWRLVPLDDIEVEVKQPLANTRSVTKEVTSKINAFSVAFDPTLKHTEFFTIKDEKVYFKITNPTKSDITRARVAFFGWKLKVKKLPAKPAKFAVIQVEVISTGQEVKVT